MHLNSIILAADDDSSVKVIFWVIVGIIWFVGSVVSALKKKAVQTRKRVDISEVPLDLTPAMEVRPVQQIRAQQMEYPRIRVSQGPPPPRTQQQRAAMPALAALAAQLRAMPMGPPPAKARGGTGKSKAKSQRRLPTPPVAPPVPYKSRLIPQEDPASKGSALPAVATPKSAHPSAASQLARALQRPGALRTQMVIAEILGKPLGLRETGDFRHL